MLFNGGGIVDVEGVEADDGYDAGTAIVRKAEQGAWRISLQATTSEDPHEHEFRPACNLDALEEWHWRNQQCYVIHDVDPRKGVMLNRAIDTPAGDTVVPVLLDRHACDDCRKHAEQPVNGQVYDQSQEQTLCGALVKDAFTLEADAELDAEVSDGVCCYR